MVHFLRQPCPAFPPPPLSSYKFRDLHSAHILTAKQALGAQLVLVERDMFRNRSRYVTVDVGIVGLFSVTLVLVFQCISVTLVLDMLVPINFFVFYTTPNNGKVTRTPFYSSCFNADIYILAHVQVSDLCLL